MDFFSNIPTHMDYKGQGRSEKLSRMIITLFGVVGLVWGYYIQQFSATVYVLGAGFLLASILTIPPWPMYRRKPLNWQKPRPPPREDGADTQSPKSKKKK
ncbi:Signal peptidase complex subunit 1 [Frankliniella fusca]|uniref:Signal peptidase complex subunit 1 n=1 Tax=Frankliniella fusca TaxID=407009 RepID=A0AAE1H0S2_9NEOP|nr:Signal peptidase complex subunit 1 [Frankliniella fusca]